MAQDQVKVILDTDIGSDIDDALALAYLLCQPRCDLLGVTTVSGQPLLRAEMVSAICRHMGRDDVPIHSGCPEGLLGPIRQRHAQQAAALGSWDRQRQFEPCTAVEFLRRTIRQNPGEVTLLAIGPMTNVGALFAIDPEIPGMLRQLVLMCGQFFVAMHGEWNAVNDAHATALTYGAGPHTRPPQHVSFGLDVTMKCCLMAQEARERFAGSGAKVLEPVRDFAEVWFSRKPSVVFHDPLAAACIFEPQLCQYRQGLVRVPQEGPAAGWTLFDDRGEDKPHTVAAEVQAEAFMDHYFQMLR